jgi:hypothetical protein
VDSAEGQARSQEERGDVQCGTDPRTSHGSAVRSAEIEPRFDRTLTLATAAREYIWLYDYEHGVSRAEIAAREGLSVSRVQFGLCRARAVKRAAEAQGDAALGLALAGSDLVRQPRLVPLFPIGPYTPESACPHRGPIRRGLVFCCMVCHRSGMDGHPALRRDPLTDPIPDPKPPPSSTPVMRPRSNAPRETRRERRRRMFAD